MVICPSSSRPCSHLFTPVEGAAALLTGADLQQRAMWGHVPLICVTELRCDLQDESLWTDVFLLLKYQVFSWNSPPEFSDLKSVVLFFTIISYSAVQVKPTDGEREISDPVWCCFTAQISSRSCIGGNWTCFRFLKTSHLSPKNWRGVAGLKTVCVCVCVCVWECPDSRPSCW